MSYTKLFYWLVVADNAKHFFIVFIAIFTAISLVSTIYQFVSICSWAFSDKDKVERENNRRVSRKWMMYSYPFMILFWSLYIFTPSKKDALLIVAGGTTIDYLASDSSAKQIPKELTNFVLVELRAMAKDAEVEVLSRKVKENVLEEAQKMSPKELIQKMKTDSTFKKYLLD